jgi:hypothetical protein
MASINDIFKMYVSPGTSTTEDGRMLALSLAEIQSELMRLREEFGKSAPIPNTVYREIDLSGLEAAVAKLTPLPPQNLDLNPVFRSYEDTAKAIRELMGEVKTTNTRIGHIGGGGGPSVVGLNDASGNRLRLSPSGAILTTRETVEETRLDYDTRTDHNPVYAGKAPQGTATTSPDWTIQLLTYDISARLIRAQVLTGAWDSRTTLNWN